MKEAELLQSWENLIFDKTIHSELGKLPPEHFDKNKHVIQEWMSFLRLDVLKINKATIRGQKRAYKQLKS